MLVLQGGHPITGASCTFDVTLLVPGDAADDTYGSTTNGFRAAIDDSLNRVFFDSARDALTVFSQFLSLFKDFTNHPVISGSTASLEFTLSNIASGAAAPDELVDLGGGTTMTVLAVMAEIEEILLDSDASNADLVDAKNLAEVVNGIFNPSCDESSFRWLFNDSFEVEFAGGCWVVYVPSTDEYIDCEGKASEQGVASCRALGTGGAFVVV